MSSTAERPEGGEAVLPRRLKGAAARARVLEETRAERLLAESSSRRGGAGTTGAAMPRESIAALYSLATQLHSPRLVYHAKAIETSESRHVTTDQIWGQLSVLLRPVLRRLQDHVREAERTFGKASSAAGGRASSAAGTTTTTTTGSSSLAARPGARESSRIDTASQSDLSESDLDEAIAGLLEEQKRRRSKKAEKKRGGGGGGDDSWRYAFGKGGDDDEDDDEEGGGWGDGEDAAKDSDAGDDDDDRNGGGRARDRNARALMEAAEEWGDEGDADDADAEEDLAALRELYGEDFEGGDGEEGLMGADDEHLERDLVLDDPARNGDDDDLDMADYGLGDGEDPFYNEERDGARVWGKDDILNEEEALHSYGGGDDDDDDPTAAGSAPVDGAEEPLDEELQRALADPNLTALERERLLEKAHIARLEQQRLFGTDWAMAGESAAQKRPREALLDVDDLQFDYGMKAVPVITEAFTGRLEDRIKQRILAQQYDDVQRRAAFSSADDLVTTRKDAALDSEKSKLSLMDLYEKDYLEKMRLAEEAAGSGATAEPLTEVERDELRAINMWKRLSQHLDALSNFFYTPKPVQQDLEARVRAVDGAAPAIAMETVGNFATSRESALAPQDLYRGSSRRFADVGTEEMTPEERRALRRAKKEDGKKSSERAEHRKKTMAKAREAQKSTAAK